MMIVLAIVLLLALLAFSVSFATQPENLFASTSNPALKRVTSDDNRPVLFANVGAAPLYPVLTPVAYDTSVDKWKVWANGGANGIGTIRGFVWPDPVQTHATGEVIGNILFAGRVNRDDIPVPAGETQNNLDAALVAGAPSLRENGIIVEGLVTVR